MRLDRVLSTLAAKAGIGSVQLLDEGVRLVDEPFKLLDIEIHHDFGLYDTQIPSYFRDVFYFNLVLLV